MAEHFREFGHGMIVPGIFQGLGGTCLAARIRRAGILARHDVGYPAVLLIFGQIAAWALGIRSVAAEELIGGRIVERDAPPGGTQVQEHGIVAVEGRVHEPALARHVELGLHDVANDVRLEQLQQHDLVSARVPEWHRTIAIVGGRLHPAFAVGEVLALACDQARARKGLEQRGVEEHPLLGSAAGYLDLVQQSGPGLPCLRTHAVEVPADAFGAQAPLGVGVARPMGHSHQDRRVRPRREIKVAADIAAVDPAGVGDHVLVADPVAPIIPPGLPKGAETREGVRKLRDEVAAVRRVVIPAPGSNASNHAVTDDLHLPTLQGKVEDDVGPIARRKGEPHQAGPPAGGQLRARSEAVEVDRVVARRSDFLGLVIVGLGVDRRNGPVADDRHQDRLRAAAIGGAAAAGEPDHGGVRIIIGGRHTGGIGLFDVDVDRRRLDCAVRKARTWGGDPRIQRLTGGRSVADQLLSIQRRSADQGIGFVDRLAPVRLRNRRHVAADQHRGGRNQAAAESRAPDAWRSLDAHRHLPVSTFSRSGGRVRLQ